MPPPLRRPLPLIPTAPPPSPASSSRRAGHSDQLTVLDTRLSPSLSILSVSRRPISRSTHRRRRASSTSSFTSTLSAPRKLKKSSCRGRVAILLYCLRQRHLPLLEVVGGRRERRWISARGRPRAEGRRSLSTSTSKTRVLEDQISTSPATSRRGSPPFSPTPSARLQFSSTTTSLPLAGDIPSHSSHLDSPSSNKAVRGFTPSCPELSIDTPPKAQPLPPVNASARPLLPSPATTSHECGIDPHLYRDALSEILDLGGQAYGAPSPDYSSPLKRLIL